MSERFTVQFSGTCPQEPRLSTHGGRFESSAKIDSARPVG